MPRPPVVVDLASTLSNKYSMSAEFIRKLLDKLAKTELMEQPPSQEFINALDAAHNKGEINKSFFDTQTADQQAMMLRNVGNYKETNPKYDSSAQGAEARAATIQGMKDSGRITADQAAKNSGSSEYFKPTTAQSTASQTKTAAPSATPPTAGSPLDLTKPIVANPKDALKLGLSTGTGVDPRLYAGLDVGNNGRLGYRGGVDGTHQLSYSHNITPNLSAQAAINQNAQGGQSAGGSLNYQLGKNTDVSATLDKDITGNQGLRAGVNLIHRFPN